jgi:hypothetical protein
MKNISIRFGLTLFVFAALLAGCEKNDLRLAGEKAGDGARVRFFTLAHNLLDGNGNALLLNVKLGNKIINGSQNLTLTAQTFPATSDYAIIPAGNTEFSFNRHAYGIQRTGRRDSIIYTDSLLSKRSFDFQNGKNYSIFLADSTPNLSIAVIEDVFENLKDTFAGIRMLNLTTKNGVKNDTFELVRRRDGRVIGTALHGQPTQFFPIESRADSFFFRRPGVTTTVYPGAAGFFATLGLTKGRNYTFLVTGTTSRASATRAMLITHQ